jgi:membrane protein DedA with SNARE-associated domain
MSELNNSIVEIFFSLEPNLRYIFITIMAFGEGLPIIGSFLPGGTIALLIGSLSEEQFIKPWHAIHLIALGSLAGDLLGFFAGRKLGNVGAIKRVIDSEKHVKKWDFFDRHAALVIIFGKILPVIRSTPALFAGARNMNILRYIFYVLIGSYVWAIAGIYGGKYLAQFLGESAIPLLLGVLVVTGLITFFSKTKKKLKKNHYIQEEE